MDPVDGTSWKKRVIRVACHAGRFVVRRVYGREDVGNANRHHRRLIASYSVLLASRAGSASARGVESVRQG